MTSISIRKDIVPLNSIIIQINSKKPLGYTNDSSFYNKYIKSTPNAGTNPGNATGSTNHQHAATGNHTHTGNTGSSHQHSVTLASSNVGFDPNATGGNITWPSRGHTHSGTSAASATTALTATSDGSHQHAVLQNQMAHKTEFFLKHSETTVGLRRRALGQNSLFMWGKDATTLPARYVKNTTLNGTHVRGVASANATPDQSGGSHNHTHDAHPGHTHTVTLPSHTHGAATSSSVGDNSISNFNFGTISFGGTHTHSVTALSASTPNNATSDSQVVASHPAQSMEVAWKSIHYVQHSSTGLRERGIPIGGIVLWTDLVANIPTGWQVADGTNGTSNYLDKYPRGETGNTTAGNTGGSNTHTHAAGGGSHTHGTINFSHTHTGPTSGGAAWQFNTFNAPGGANTANSLQGSHTHPMNVANAVSSGSLQGDTDAHTHDSQNHEPPGILVAFIERLA